MNIEKQLREIEKTEYWDMPILDIQTSYFGDEITIYIENTKDLYWEISFLSCYKVNYETDANWRGIKKVSKMRGGQLGYYGQDISLKKYEENEKFIHCVLDLSIITMEIICQDIFVKEISTEEISFFWEDK